VAAVLLLGAPVPPLPIVYDIFAPGVTGYEDLYTTPPPPPPPPTWNPPPPPPATTSISIVVTFAGTVHVLVPTVVNCTTVADVKRLGLCAAVPTGNDKNPVPANVVFLKIAILVIPL
jgi:hypothetical protein